MFDLLFLVALAAAVLITAVWGWTGWFLLLGTGLLVFSAYPSSERHLILLGSLLLLALGIEWKVVKARERCAIPEALISKAVISGGTQLVLGSLFHPLLALGVWWMGLGRFLWEQPAEEREAELRRAKHWGRLLVLRFTTALIGAALILGCS